jgi:hypothetical protein
VSALYVYALAGAPPAVAMARGIAGEPVAAVEVGGFVALVGAVEREPAPSGPSLRAHDAVVRRLAEATPALLPARFASLVDDEAALRRALEPRASELRAALALVEGREQMILRVFAAAAAAAPPGEPPIDPALGPGARYLAGRAAAVARAREATEIAPLRPALAALIRAERIERHETVVSVYHLVDRGAAAHYGAAVDGSAASLAPVRVAWSGPWPAYAFAPEALA